MNLLKKIDHIGIAVRSIDDSIMLYRDTLLMEYLGTKQIDEQKVRVALFRVGDIKIELLEPVSEDSPIAKFLLKRGSGIHHIAYQIQSISEIKHQLKKNDVQIIEQGSRTGVDNSQILFCHPRSTDGVLIEFVEMTDE